MTNTLDITLIVALATLAVSITTLLLECIRARKAEREKIVERTHRIFAEIIRYRSNATVTVTNVGLTNFTIEGIDVLVGNKKITVEEFSDEKSQPARFRKFLPHGADISFTIPMETLDNKPVDVIPMIVVHVSASAPIKQDLKIRIGQ